MKKYLITAIIRFDDGRLDPIIISGVNDCDSLIEAIGAFESQIRLTFNGEFKLIPNFQYLDFHIIKDMVSL
jgi:hypothetical protein